MKRRITGKGSRRFKGRSAAKSAVRINQNLAQSSGLNSLIKVDNQGEDSRNMTMQV